MALTDLDRQLLKRCLSSDPAGWKDFVDRFMPLFVHVIQHAAASRSVKVSASDVDDLCSEVFCALLENDFAVLRHFRGRSSLATYLTVVSRRVIVREIARRRLAESFGHVQAHGDSIEQAHASAPSDLERVENREQVEQMLTHLSGTDAEVVRLYHLEAKSYREISDQLGIAENSIGPTLSRARERLRRG